MVDISSDTAIATSTTVARTLANRFADEYSVEDFGVVNDTTGTYAASNTTAYQTALNTAKGKARLRHRAGLTVFIDAPLVMGANTVWELDGFLKLAVVTTWTSGNCLIQAASNSIIEGVGIIDGNSANQTVSGVIGGINGNPTNFVAKNITVQNTRNWPWNVGSNTTYATNCYALNCTFNNGGSSVEFGSGCTNCWFIGCTVSNISDLGVGFYGTATNCGITGCQVSTCSSCGPFVYDDSIQPGTATNVIIANNVVTNCQGNGIFVGGLNGPTAVSIVNNQCIGNDGPGIIVARAYNVIVEGNYCSGNNASGTSYVADVQIGVDGASNSGSIVTGNMVINPGKGTALVFGISVYAPSECFSFGNIIADLRSPSKMIFGLYGPSGNYLYTHDNLIYGATASFEQDSISYNSTSFQGFNLICGPGLNPGQLTGSPTFLGTPRFTANLESTSSGLQTQGLTFGWNASDQGDCSIFCAGGTASGSWNGLYVYGVDDTGTLLSGPMSYGAYAKISPTGTVQAGAGFQQSDSGPTWTSGAGAPTSTQPVGSLYSRTGGTTGSRLYVSAGGGSWNAVAGV